MSAAPVCPPDMPEEHDGESENVLSEDELRAKYAAISKTEAGRIGWMRWMFNWNPKSQDFNPRVLTIAEYKRLADGSLATSWRLLHTQGWRLEKRGSTKGDVVESLSTKEFGKVFRFTGTVECPAKWLYEDLRDNFTRMPEWNPTILHSEIIKVLAPGVDLSYQVTAGGGSGLISERDFVMLRRVCCLDADGCAIADAEAESATAYVTNGLSVECPGYPPVKKYVRGDTKVGAWFMRPHAHRASTGHLDAYTTFQWLFSCDLKGRMPPFVLDAAFATVMLESVQHIRKHAAEARNKGLF